ncbi:hypothetical protein D3C81_1854820 [compost metagenome]
MSTAFAISSREIRDSYSFSPWRVPITLTGAALLKIFFKASARSPTVEAGAFCTKMSPCSACSNACRTRSTESSSDMRKRVMLGSVMVSDSPALICWTNSGITEPREAITLP